MEKYKVAKGSAGIKGIPKGVSGKPKKAGKGLDPAGMMDSRPSNSDRNQSAK